MTSGDVTRQGLYVGTPHDTSPKQVRGQLLDPRSHLFRSASSLRDDRRGASLRARISRGRRDRDRHRTDAAAACGDNRAEGLERSTRAPRARRPPRANDRPARSRPHCVRSSLILDRPSTSPRPRVHRRPAVPEPHGQGRGEVLQRRHDRGNDRAPVEDRRVARHFAGHVDALQERAGGRRPTSGASRRRERARRLDPGAGTQVRVTASLTDVAGATQLGEKPTIGLLRTSSRSRPMSPARLSRRSGHSFRTSASRRRPEPGARRTSRSITCTLRAGTRRLAQPRTGFSKAGATSARRSIRSDLRPRLRGPGDDVRASRQLRISAGARRFAQARPPRSSARIRPESAGGPRRRCVGRLLLRVGLAGGPAIVRQALRLNESYADAHQYDSLFLASELRHDEAILQARRALELNPLSPAAGANVALVLTMAGRYDEALEDIEKLRYLHPDFPPGHVMLASTLLNVGRDDEGSLSSRSGAGRARTSDGPTRWPAELTRRARFWRSSSLLIIAGRSI